MRLDGGVERSYARARENEIRARLERQATLAADRTLRNTTAQTQQPTPQQTFEARRNTDSFERSGPSGGPVGTAGRLEGFDHNKLNDPNHNTPKYVVGRILSRYPNTPEGLRQAMPEIQKYFPDATILPGGKGDKIDFGRHTYDGQQLGVIDVIRAAGGPNNGEGWQWLPDGPSTRTGGADLPFNASSVASASAPTAGQGSATTAPAGWAGDPSTTPAQMPNLDTDALYILQLLIAFIQQGGMNGIFGSFAQAPTARAA